MKASVLTVVDRASKAGDTVCHEELGKLRASLDYCRVQIDDFMSMNVVLKLSMQIVENNVTAFEKENRQLREALLDLQRCSMRDNNVFSGAPTQTRNLLCSNL